MKWLIRAPPTNSSSAIRSVNSIATDRSGSSAASTSSTPITTTNGTRPLVKRLRLSPFLTMSIDTQTTTASFANSDGWKKAPRAVNRWRDSAGQNEHGEHRGDREPHDRPGPAAQAVGIELGGHGKCG